MDSNSKDLVRELVERSAPVFDTWSEPTAMVWVRAGFRCEYCNQHLLENYDMYRSSEAEHILPKSKYGECGLHGLALACRVCNQLKLCLDLGDRDLWTRLQQGCPDTRRALLQEYGRRIKEKRQEKEMALNKLRAYVEASGILADPGEASSAGSEP